MIVKIKQVSGLTTALDTKVSGAGSGTLNYVTKWSSSTGVIDSQIRDNGTSVGIAVAPSSFDKVLIDADSLSNGLKVQNNDSGYAIRTVSDGANATSANIAIEGISKGATAAVGASVNIAGLFVGGSTVPADVTTTLADTFGAVVRAHESTKKTMALYVDSTTSNSEDNIGLYVKTENVGAGNNYAMIVPTGGGNVGLGVSLPTAQLHIVGNLRLVDGTQAANYVLTSDASGNASWEQNVVNVRKTVWISSVYGDDLTGLVENSNKPFQTIEAAMNAVHSTYTGDWYINIDPGTYNETTEISTVANFNYVFNCDKNTNINFSSNRTFNYTGATTDRRIVINGGKWYHNGISIMFDGYTVNYFIINDAYLQNNTGTLMFQRYVISEMNNCILIGVVSPIFWGGGGLRNINDCYIEAQSDYIFYTAGGCRGFNFKNCRIISLTAGFSSYIGSASQVAFEDCYIETFNRVIYARGLNLTMNGFNYVKITNTGNFLQFAGNGALEGRFLQFDTTVVNQTEASGSNCITTTDDNKVDAFILNKLYVVKPITSSVIAKAGFIINTATIGNNITFNLPFPYNNNPILYTLASTDKTAEKDAIKALVTAEVTNPASDWYKWTNGDLTKFTESTNWLRVACDEQLPGGFSIRSNTNTVTDDFGQVLELNVGWSGLFNHGVGDVVILPDNIESYVGSGLRIIDRITRYNKENY